MCYIVYVNVNIVVVTISLGLVPALAAADTEPTAVPAARAAVEAADSFGGVDWFEAWRVPLSEPLVTDRPDFTESALAVPRGWAQLEAGYTFSYDREGTRRVTDHTFPEFLLRTGLFTDVELRLAWAGWSLTETLDRVRNEAGRRVWQKDHEDGGNDMSIGGKAHLFDQDGLIPSFGIIAELAVPTGSQSKSADDVVPLTKLLWEYDLSERVGLAGNVNFAVPPDEAGGRFLETAASVALGYDLNDWLGVYTEYFGIYPAAGAADDTHYINGGFTFLLTPNLQLDVRCGFGLNDAADDLFCGAGFAVRF